MSWRFKAWGLLWSKTMRATLIVVVGNVVSMGLAVVFTILAARWLGPESWGIVAGVGSLVTILVAFGELGMGAGILRFVSYKLGKGEGDAARAIFKVIFTGRLFMAGVFVLALLGLAPLLSRWIFGSGEVLLIWFAALGLVGFLLLDFQVRVVEAEQKWKTAAGFYVLSNGLRLVLLLVLARLGFLSLWGVLAIFTGSALLGFLLSLLWRRVEVGGVRDWRKVVREVGPFSGWMAVNKIVSTFNSRVDVLLLLPLAGAYEAGIYAAANRLALGVPIVLSSLATVLAQRFATFDKDEEVGRFLKKSMGLAGVVSLGLMVGVGVAPWVVSFFGPEYGASVRVLQWMFVAFVPFAVAVPAVNAIIYGLEKPGVVAVVSLVQLPMILGINYGLIPKIGVMAPVVAMGAVNVSLMLVAYGFVIKRLRR